MWGNYTVQFAVNLTTDTVVQFDPRMQVCAVPVILVEQELCMEGV